MLWKKFLSFNKDNGMLQAKEMSNVLFSLPSIAQYVHRFRIVWQSGKCPP